MSNIRVEAATYLMSKGIPRNGAIAVAAVLYFESGLHPGSQGHQATETPGVLNPHGAYGIASWNGPRQAALQAFCNSKGIPVENVNSQLWFVLNECANRYHKSWAAMRDQGMAIATIITTFVDEYENPADKSKEIAGSESIAAEFQASVPVSVPIEAQIQIPTAAPPTAPIVPSTTPEVSTVNPALVLQILVQIVTIISDITAVVRSLHLGSAPASTPASLAATGTPPINPSPHTASFPFPQLPLAADPNLAATLEKILAALAAISPPQQPAA